MRFNMQSSVHSFFFFLAWLTDPPLWGGGRWETKHFMGIIALWTPSFPRKLYFFDKIIHVQPYFVPGQFCPWMFLKCIWWIHFCSLQKSLIITFVRNSSIHVYNFAWKLKKPKKSYYFSAIFQTCFCLISEVWVNPSQETLLSTKHLTLFPPPLLPPCSLIFRITSKKRLKFREVGYKAHICSPVKTFNSSRQDNQSNRC